MKVFIYTVGFIALFSFLFYFAPNPEDDGLSFGGVHGQWSTP